MLLGQELKFKNKLCNLKLGTLFSALPRLGASTLSGRVGLTCETRRITPTGLFPGTPGVLETSDD